MLGAMLVKGGTVEAEDFCIVMLEQIEALLLWNWMLLQTMDALDNLHAAIGEFN